MFDDVKNAANENFFAAYIRKNKNAYLTVLAIVLTFEIVMFIRGVFMFDFDKTRHQLYMLSYVLLSAATAVGLIVTFRNAERKISAHVVTLVLHGYCSAIIAWALLVSYLDLSVGNTAIVYLTVIMSVGGLSVIHPIYYGVNVLLSLLILFILSRVGGFSYFDSVNGGLYINLTVFVIVSCLLAFRHYRISRRELEMSVYLEQLSYHDQLTGIYNRRMYEMAAQKADNENEDALVVIFDFDRFKTINDTWGHDLGDQSLTVAARALEEFFGERSFRIGGDEFVSICARTGREEQVQKLGNINRRLEESFPGKNISISAGFAVRRDFGSVEKALHEADKALYAAKGEGGKRCCFAADLAAKTKE